MVAVETPASMDWQRACKRVIDVVVGNIAFCLLSPLLILIGLAIKLTSPGPILYHWRVVGQNGRPFVSYKFRSMVVNADAMKAALEATNEMSGPVFKMKADPRITPIGRVLRKFSLDELPQLWSVIKGDMSLVGPRPPLQTEYAQFSDYQKQKLRVKPGITCLWQISGRNNIRDFDQWVQLDLEYIRHWSLWLDLKILFMTIPAVVRGRGAS
jgi:exopolysaccharide biosynthesis polyprenyl glycosylphosphotransferase